MAPDNLFNDPNRFADKPGLVLDEVARFTGYQKFSLTASEATPDPSDKKLRAKKRLVRKFFNPQWLKDRTVLDLGANSAFFCFHALHNGAGKAIALDIDDNYLDIVRRVKEYFRLQNLEIRKGNILEYETPADVVLAFALVHWIYSCTATYGSLERVVAKLSSLARHALIVEWVEPGDEAIEFFGHLDWNSSLADGRFDRETFLNALGKHFDSVEYLGQVTGTRHLYAANRKASNQPESPKHASSVSLPDLSCWLDEHQLTYVWLHDSPPWTEHAEIVLADVLHLLLAEDHLKTFENILGLGKKQACKRILELDFGKKQRRTLLLHSPGYSLDKDLATRLLHSREKKGDHYVLPSREYFHWLLYHVICHKGMMTDVYLEKFRKLNAEASIGFEISRATDFSYGCEFLQTRGIKTAIPSDPNLGPSLPYLFPPEQVIYSRWLGANGGVQYQSRVYLVEDQSKKKIYKQASSDLVKREIDFLARLASEHFPMVYGCRRDKDYSVGEMEWIEGYPLTETERFVKEHDAEGAKQFFCECLEILETLKNHGITHRDIRGENILVRGGKPVLIDFGWAMIQGSSNLTLDGLGKEGRPPDGSFCDVYSMGVALRPVAFFYPDLAEIVDVMTKTNPDERITDVSRLKEILLKNSGSLEPFKNASLTLAQYLAEKKEFDRAEEILTKVLARDSDAADVLNLLGDLASEKNEVPAAEAYFRQAIEVDGKCHAARLNYALLLRNTNRVEAAIEHLEVLLQNEPNHSKAHNEIGVILFQKGELDRAVKHFTQAVENDPSNIAAVRNRADLMGLLGNIPEAIRGYQAILDSDPRDVEALLSLGSLCRLHGSLEEARFFYNRVLQIDPFNELARRNLEELNALTPGSGEIALKEQWAKGSETTPQVSIIIPVFNQIKLTRNCLEAIYRTTPAGLNVEVIVVNDASTDETPEFLKNALRMYQRFRAVTNSENAGFAKSCNIGAKAARGKYLVFLNNDTLPKPGWLSELLQVIEGSENIGIVGSKLIFPAEQGGGSRFERVQHCGIAFNARKESLHIYKFCLSSQPFVNKRRQVQAVTGAALLIPSDLFWSIGGFDEQYRNGGEDLDLCFKVRAKGKEVVYCPTSELYHYESVTIRSMGRGGHSQRNENYKRFLQRFGDSIKADEYVIYQEDGLNFPSESNLRFAMVSPLGPQKSGVADYTHELLPFLSKHARIDLFVDGFVPTDPTVVRHHLVHRITDLRYVDWMHHYDQIIYHIGNNRFHRTIYQTAKQLPGIVVLHEYDAKGCSDAPNNKELLTGLFERSKGIIVHNSHSKELLQPEFPDLRIEVIPHLLSPHVHEAPVAERLEMRRRLKIPDDAFVIVSLGLVVPHKRNHVTLKAFAEFVKEDPKAMLILGGEAPYPRYKRSLEAAVSEENLHERVRLTGWLSEVDFFAYLEVADATVNLRYPSRGEDSGTLTRILGAGKPAIVSNYAQYADLPDDCVIKVNFENEVNEILQAFRRLSTDSNYWKELAARSQQHMRKHNSPQRVAAMYASFCTRTKDGTKKATPKRGGRARILWEAPVWKTDNHSRELVLALDRLGLPIKVRPTDVGRTHAVCVDAEDLTRLREMETAPLDEDFVQVYCGNPEEFRRNEQARFAIILLQRVDHREVGKLKYVPADEYWVPSTYCRTCLVEAGVPASTIQIVPCGVSGLHYGTTVVEKLLEGPFRFRAMTDWSDRTGWEILVGAFLREFRNDKGVNLCFKSTLLDHSVEEKERLFQSRMLEFIRKNPEFNQRDYSKIFHDGRTLGANEMPGYSASADAFVSPNCYSSSGRAVLEAMAVGIPVLATESGGQCDFVSDRNAIIVKHTHRNGRVTIEELYLRKALRYVYENRLDAQAKGAVARDQALRSYTWHQIAKGVADRFLNILGTPLAVNLETDFESGVDPATESHVPVDHMESPSSTPLSAFSELASEKLTPVQESPSVLWVAPYANPSGYANETIHLVQGLARLLPVRVVNRGSVSSAFVNSLPPELRGLFVKLERQELRSRPLISVEHNPASMFVRIPKADYCIGRTTYETDRIPRDWVDRCNQMDEVWVPTSFNLQTFVRSGVHRDKLVKIPQSIDIHFFDPKRTSALELPARRKFNFLSMFEWSERKGWDILLRAYFEEFSAEEDVCLFLRTYLMNRTDKNDREEILQRIKKLATQLRRKEKDLPHHEVLEEQIPAIKLPELYKAVDAFVLPSRGEGWGRAHMEAMAMGLPTIGTNWSGNTEFMTEGNSYLISIDGLVNVERMEIRSYLGHRWAQPSLKHLRKIMRKVFQNPGEAKARGAKARKDIAQKYSCEKVGELMLERFDQITAKLGSREVGRTTVGLESEQVKKKIRVLWEGPQFVRNSIALINREQCLKLLSADRYELQIAPGDVDPTFLRNESRFTVLTQHALEYQNANPRIIVRHSWPPNFDPEPGPTVVIQIPWEFGSLPESWIDPLNHAMSEIWVPSTYVKEVFLDSFIDEGKVFVIPNGFDPRVFRPDGEPLQLAAKKSFKFLFVGGTIYRKGIDVLLDTYRSSFRANDDVVLIIKDMGVQTFYRNQTFGKTIREIQEDPEAPAILYLTEDLTDETMAGLYRTADCLVHPYRGEGFALPVLEAMACGLPVIVTLGGATDDFVDDASGYRISAKKSFFGNHVDSLKLVKEGWFLEIDRSELAKAMRFVYENPAEAASRGRHASMKTHAGWTWGHSSRKVLERLDVLANIELVPA